MKKIEVRLPFLMSLLVNSISGSESDDIIEEDDIIDEGEDNDALSMSDEEFEKLSEDDFTENDDVSDTDVGDIDESLGDGEEDENEDEANGDEPADSADDDGSEQAEDEDESENDQPSGENQTTNSQVYEDTYKQLFESPIKANGRDFQLKDGAQARSLIEMGVDYNKKMQHMRPHMQTLKTLEKEGLLEDTEQLNLLLEAKQGNPEAIKRLLSQADIDLVDIADDDEGKEKYVPQNHIVSQAEVDIEQALNSISRSPAYQETIDTMSNSFDAKSKEIISENPSYITALNSDIESGLYPRVMDMVQYQRDTRRIPDGMSDIEAYIGTVQQMAEQEQREAQAAPAPVQSEPQAKRNPSNRKRKVGMSGSRSTPKKGGKREYDPMEIMTMSDDDFEKKFGSELL